MSKTIPMTIAAAAVGLVLPAASPAASVVLSYFNIQTSTSPTFAAGTVTTWATPNVIPSSVPLYLRYTVRAQVANNPNPGAASGYLIDTDDDGTGDTPQPATLGIGAFGAYTSQTGAVVTPVNNSGLSTAAINALFASVSSSGTVVGNNVGDPASLASFIAGGTNSGAVNASQAGNLTRLSIGANATAANNNLFATLQFVIPANLGGVSFLTTNVPSTSFAFVANATPGDASTAPTYTNRNFNPATDTLTGPGTIIIGIPEPASLSVLGLAGFGLLARRRKA